MHEAAVSRTVELRPPRPLSAGELEKIVSGLLLRLAEGLSVKGVVPGHIKAFVAEGEPYAAFSCTKPGKVATRASKDWSASVFVSPSFSLNVVVFGPAKEEVENLVEVEMTCLVREMSDLLEFFQQTIGKADSLSP